MLKTIKKYGAGLVLTALLGAVASYVSGFIPYHLISAGVFAMLIGMLLNPVISKYSIFKGGIALVSKQVLRLAIILMGVTLSFSQVLKVGKYSLLVMCFTLAAAFGGGYLLGKAFGMNWKLSGLISAGTGICGGSAIAAIAPTIDADDKDVAYAISATFLFDIVMVILFPIAGRYFGMSDMGFGLWAGTAVNDTSSVVAAGYAFSDAAGAFAMIVKLTRTLSIIPAVLIFSFINERINS
ncbi:MAG: putative sulfate exporter family transporter, partial [Oscillospiraceae bacterium]